MCVERPLAREGTRCTPHMAMSRPRIAIVSSLLHPRYGGPPSVVGEHASVLREAFDVDVFGVASPAEALDLSNSLPEAKVFERAWPGRWFRGRHLGRELLSQGGRYDVIWAHMFWDQPVLAAWVAARLHRRPFIVTPHGSLQEGWRRAGAVKSIYLHAVGHRLLREASFVHVLTAREQEALQAFEPRANVRLIGNSVGDEILALGAARASAEGESRRVLFLGRLAPEKNLRELLRAVGLVGELAREKGFTFELVGPDSGEQGALEALRTEKALSDIVSILPPVDPAGRLGLLREAGAFVLVSKGEGLSMALLEAAGSGLPVVLARECNLPALIQAGGGWEVGTDAESIAQGLRAMMAEPAGRRRERGARAHDFVQARYSRQAAGRDLLDAALGLVGERGPVDAPRRR